MADNTNPFGDARAAQQFSRDFARYMEGAMNSYFAGQQFQGMRNNMASQASMSDRLRSSENSDGWQFNSNNAGRNPYKPRKGLMDDFEDAFAKEMLNALTGGDFQQNINKALTNFSKNMGFDISELGQKLGQNMAKQALNSKLGTEVKDKVRDVLVGENGILSKKAGDLLGKFGNEELKNVFNQFVGDMFNVGGSGAVEATMGGVADAATLAEGGMATLGTAGVEAGAGIAASETAIAGLTTMLSTALPPILIGMAAIVVASEVLGPALEGLGEIASALGGAALRSDEERAKRREAAQKRLQADIDYMVKQPFEILTQAATDWYNAWDNNLRTISQTQGYDKESVYNLYSSYAERLREEGLSNAIPATSIIDGLKQVLSTGLSGKAAEEFAYQATKLQEAVPAMGDFFQYAGSYAQIASNAIAQGATQAEALDLANAQLTAFANNVLYANRELAGGFNTGLSNASQLFTDAVNIAQTAKTGNANAISGVLTSVSAVVGAVAPDLANGLVQNIVNAAIGGNNENIVALRSLAGINASNTEFLRAFAEDPQAIFSSLFNKLAQLQSMSNDNFMEVAEGLAPIFGVDMAALARVDFSYLADAITDMNINSTALADNIDMLASGESTTTAEQAKMAEINQIILEDGLGIVMDNEAARVIQEHMWQEQQTVALTSAEYAVNLQGSALQFIEGIAQTVTNIVRFLNPIGAISEMVSNIAATGRDYAQQQAALTAILEGGAIKANNTALSNLTNYSGTGMLDVFNEGMSGSTLQGVVNTRLASMLGFEANSLTADALDSFSEVVDRFGRASGGLLGMYSGDTDDMLAAIGNGMGSIVRGVDTLINGPYAGSNNSISSSYRWGTVGKSSSLIAALTQKRSAAYANTIASSVSSAEEAQREAEAFSAALSASIAETNRATLTTAMSEATGRLESSVSFGDTQKSYEQWKEEFIRQQGEGFDFTSTLDQYGMTEEQVRGRFQAQQAQSQSSVAEQRANAETAFYEDARNALEQMRKYWGYETSAEGVYKDNIWQPYMDFWDIGSGNYKSQFWTPFFADNMKFDQGILKIFNEMVNQRDNWIGAPTTEGTVRGLLHTINATLIAFNDSFNSWVQEWTDFYINHTTYTERTTSADWNELLNMEQATRDDTSLAIANALEAISNIEDLKDPTVQQNVLLAKIVVLLEAIMQQNNSTGGLALPDSLSALGLGIVTRT